MNRNTKEKLTFAQLCDIFLNHSERLMKESTVITYGCVIKKVDPLIGNVKLNKITKEMIQDIFDEYDKKYSKEYVQKIYYTIRQIFDFAVRQEMIKLNPMAKVTYNLRKNEIKKEMDFYEPHEFDIFIKYCDGEYKDFFLFLYFMGTRKAETQALVWSDVDFKGNVVRINKTLTHKTNKGSWIITSPKTANSNRNINMPIIISEMLKEKKAKLTEGIDCINDFFVFGTKKPLSSETLRRKKNEAVKKANEDGNSLKTIRIHDFRHSHVSYLINNKSDRFNDYDIAYRLGDTIATIQETYAHMFLESGRKISDFIDRDLGTSEKKQKDYDILPYEELKQLKELLDLKIITLEEFNDKKKELLGF